MTQTFERLADALDELGRHSEAVQSYRAALERAPDQPRF